MVVIPKELAFFLDGNDSVICPAGNKNNFLPGQIAAARKDMLFQVQPLLSSSSTLSDNHPNLPSSHHMDDGNRTNLGFAAFFVPLLQKAVSSWLLCSLSSTTSTTSTPTSQPATNSNVNEGESCSSCNNEPCQKLRILLQIHLQISKMDSSVHMDQPCKP